MERATALHRLLYRSEVDIFGTEADIQTEVSSIVQAAQASNTRAGLTGALVYIRGTFIQVMEGPPTPVEATFERICCDLRHRQVELLEFVPAAERAFAEWSMARIIPGVGFERVLPIRTADVIAEAASTQDIIQLMHTMLLQRDERVPV